MSRAWAVLAFHIFLNGVRKQWLACVCNVHLSYAWLRVRECMGAEALQRTRFRISVQYNLHGMHACGGKHVENPCTTWRPITLWHLHACCKHRMEGSHVQTLSGHAQADDERQHLPSFNCDAYVSPQSQQTCENKVKKNCTPRMHTRSCTTCT